MTKKLNISLTIISICTLLLFTSCSEKIVYPPVRFVEDGIYYTYSYYDLDYDIEQSIAIAHIRIGNWLYEVGDSGGGYTVYEATVLSCYKGSLPDKFPLAFDGNSKINLADSPLPTYGNEFFVFFEHYKGENDEYYYSMQNEFSCFDVIKKDEEKYLLGYMDNNILNQMLEEISNYQGLGYDLIKTKKENDPFWNDYPLENPKYVFKLEDVEAALEGKIG